MAISETRNKGSVVRQTPLPSPTATSPTPGDKALSGAPQVKVDRPRPPRRDPVANSLPQHKPLAQRQVDTAQSPQPRQSDSSLHNKAFGPKDLQRAAKSSPPLYTHTPNNSNASKPSSDPPGETATGPKAFGPRNLQQALAHARERAPTDSDAIPNDLDDEVTPDTGEPVAEARSEDSGEPLHGKTINLPEHDEIPLPAPRASVVAPKNPGPPPGTFPAPTQPGPNGELIVSEPLLQPKTYFDKSLLPPANLRGLLQSSQLPASLQKTMDDLITAMATDDATRADKLTDKLFAQLRPLLDTKYGPPGQKLAFTLSDGKAFIADLRQQIVSRTPILMKGRVGQLFDDSKTQAKLRGSFDKLVSGLLDKAIKSDALGPKRIEVNGKVYERSDTKALAKGQFGAIWVFHNPKDPSDRVVLKQPLLDNVDKHHRDPRHVQFDDPLAEGQLVVQAMGSGGGSADAISKLVGVLRNEDQVQLVFKYEPGGSLKGLLEKIDRVPDPELAKGKLGLMLDMVGGVQRLQEAKGIVHFDLALRNVLVDARGHALITDFGMAEGFADGSKIDGASTTTGKPADAPIPIRWAAPEVLLHKPATAKSDVFSLGVTFLEMAHSLGRSGPWPYLPNLKVFEDRVSGWDADGMVGPIDADAWPGVDTAALRALIVRMLDADPAKRPTLDEVANSPVFADIKPDDREALRNVIFKS